MVIENDVLSYYKKEVRGFWDFGPSFASSFAYRVDPCIVSKGSHNIAFINANLKNRFQNKKEKCGEIKLKLASDVQRVDYKGKKNCFQLVTPDRVYHVCAESDQEMNAWIAQIKAQQANLLGTANRATQPGPSNPAAKPLTASTPGAPNPIVQPAGAGTVSAAPPADPVRWRSLCPLGADSLIFVLFFLF
jgi:hypothetical protein